MLENKRPIRYALWIIIAVAIFLRLVYAFYMGDQVEALPGIHDQISYDALAHSLLAGQGYSFNQYWYPFTPAHTPTAHWSFLYPLYLAGVYALCPHPLAARLLQAILSGLASIWLLYHLARQVFGGQRGAIPTILKGIGAPLIGLVTAALGAVYIYFMYYDAALMTESFFMAGVLAMLNLALTITRPEIQSARRQIVLWGLLGVVLSVTALLRQTILLWMPFLLGWMLWAGRGRIRAWQALIPLLITALFILPWTVRNYRVYNAFLPLNSNAGYALYSANHPDHGTHFIQTHAAPLPKELKGLNEAQLNGELMSRGFEFILREPGRYLLLSLSRIPVYFKFWPSSDSSTLSNISRVLSFGLYLPFFLYGLFLSRHDWRRCSLIYLFGVVYSLMHILTWASIRYRLPVDAALMPFAALAVIAIARRFGIIRTVKEDSI